MSSLVSSSDCTLQLVELAETFELRRDVLRPWLTREMVEETYAGQGEHFHCGALQDGRLVSTAGFAAERHPGYESEFGAVQWRLRGMATFPECRGRGLGGAVLEFGLTELSRRLAVQQAVSAVVWCNGRTGAQSFYERHGFRPIGEIFETPGTGPHYVFWRRIDAAAAS